MLQCPNCKQEIALPDDQIADRPARCLECQSALPPEPLIPPSVKIKITSDGAVLRFSRFARAKTFFYLTGAALIVLLTEPATRHWRDHNFSTIWVEAIFGVLAVGALAWLIYELCGKNEIRQTGQNLTLFTGVGPFGVSCRFAARDVGAINFVSPGGNDLNDRADCHIELTLTGGQCLTFFKSHDRDAVQFFYLWLRQKTNLT